MAETFHCNFDTADIDAQLDALTQAAGEATRPAAQAGAQVLYSMVRVLAPVADRPTSLGDGRMSVPGALKAAIYQVYSEDNSVDGKKATYHVSWNAKKAPHGHLVEHGTSRMAARPFVRPAFDAAQGAALRVAQQTLEKSLSPYTGSGS